MGQEATSTNNQGPFLEVLNNLDDAAKKISALVHPVTTLQTLVHDADSFVQDVDSLFKGVDEACQAMTGVRDVCYLLDPIPVIGEVSSIAGSVLGDVLDVANPIRNRLHPIRVDVVEKGGSFLKKADHGLTTVRNATVTMTQKVPDATNTIAILDCMARIAEPLAEVLSGDEVADRLNKILKTYETIRDDVSTVLLPVTEVIDVIATVIKDLADVLDDILNTVMNAIGGAVNVVRSIASVLHPIGSALDAVKSAIKPIEWVLDAVECIIDTILKPVINAILEATGLKTLINSMEKALMDKLGLTGLIDKIEKSFHLDAIQQSSATLNPDASDGAPHTISNGWSNLSGALGKYATKDKKSDGPGFAVSELYTAITNTALDPDKPASIPDWPDPPKLHKPDGDANNQQENTFLMAGMVLSAASAHPKRRKPFEALNNLQQLAEKPHLLKAPAKQARLQIQHPFTLHAERWSNLDSLDSQIDKTCQRLNGLTDKVQLVAQKLVYLQGSLQVPSTFHAQIVDLKIFLSTGRDLLMFLAGIDLFKDVLSPLAGILQTQVVACHDVDRDAPLLIQAVASIETAVGPALTHMPTDQLLAQATHKMQGWKLGAATLAKTMDVGHDLATDTSHTEELHGYGANVNTRFKAVGDIATKIFTVADGLSNSLDAMSDALDGYAKALLPISEHDTLISEKALPQADKAARILGTIDSIFDPLSTLLQRTHCVDGNSMLKLGANDAIDALKQVADSDSSSPLKLTINLLEALADKALPLGRLHTEMGEATQTLSSSIITAVQGAAKDIGSNMDHLKVLLHETQTFTFTDAQGKTQTVSNQFVSGDMQKPITLAKTLSKQ